jgi:hypothetical protein
MERKKLVKDLNDLATKLTIMEGKKHSINVADMKEILSCLIALDATSIIASRKSVVMILRREARKLAAKKRVKK